MNRGGIPRHRSWGHVFAPQLVEEEQTGVVPPAGEGHTDPRGASLAAANRDPRQFDDPDPLARIKPQLHHKTTARRRPHRPETCAR
jgi:hypothetical protein